jgi:hypothetical protein
MNEDANKLLKELQDDFNKFMNMSDDEFEALMVDYYYKFLNPEE